MVHCKHDFNKCSLVQPIYTDQADTNMLTSHKIYSALLQNTIYLSSSKGFIWLYDVIS